MSTDFLRSEAELVLAKARKEKSNRTKSLGSPIHLNGTALSMKICDGNAWVAENTTLIRKIDLETGNTLQTYRGHTGPVSALTFCDEVRGSGDSKILITGSWDQSIKLWNTVTKQMISSTLAHSDFVKSLLVFPSLQLLISGGSDMIVRFWYCKLGISSYSKPRDLLFIPRDLSSATERRALTLVGSVASHRRPIECLDGKEISDTSAILYTADTMGVIKVWDLVKENDVPNQWRSTLKHELNHHRTGINDMLYGDHELWTASSDDTVQILPHDVSTPLPPIAHPVAVRTILPLALTDLAEPYLITGAGDIIRVFDVSSPREPELISEIDAHWHDVTVLRLWMRKFVGPDNKARIEPWIVSTSLDGTIRKWRLSELLNPTAARPIIEKEIASSTPKSNDQFEMTKEEEEELAELDLL